MDGIGEHYAKGGVILLFLKEKIYCRLIEIALLAQLFLIQMSKKENRSGRKTDTPYEDLSEAFSNPSYFM